MLLGNPGSLEKPKREKMVGGYSGFLYLDKKGTPHVCRHTYCSNQAKAGMNPKTLQYLMGHSDISVPLNTYTHQGLENAEAEMVRMAQLENARREQALLMGESGAGKAA